MKIIKLLYLEHDPDSIRRFKRSFKLEKLENINIELTICENIEDGITQLIKNKFDLILTDILWPNSKGVEDNKLFPVIIKKIREVDSRITIVALSGQGDTHNEAKKYKDEIYDIWSKSGGYPEFLPYRIEHLIYFWQNEMAEKALISAIEIFINENPNSWGVSSIKTFIESYTKKLMTSGDLFVGIIQLFKDLANIAGLKTEQTNNLLTAFSKFEPLDLAKKTTSWGHLRHTLSVFFIGYLLINEQSQFLFKKIKSHTSIIDIFEMNQTWFLASIFHDSSIFLENIITILTDIESYVAQNKYYNFRICDTGKELPKVSQIESYSDKELFETVNLLLTNFDLTDNKTKFNEYISENVYHGIIGAVNLYKNNIENVDIPNRILQEACFSILTHKCFQTKNLNLNLRDNKFIFSQLLCLIDSFQAWGRESQYKNIYDDTSIEKVVLRDVSITLDNSLKFKLNIDYLPFNYLSPSDERLIRKDIPKLKDIIRNLYDELDKIAIIKDENGNYTWQEIFLDFSFLIQGKSMFD